MIDRYSYNNLPRFTIITSTLNCAIPLKKTALSIREQTYTNIQWIIADGASTDGTLEVIKENIDIVTHWFSGPDSGIYDAWNKGCALIDGDWVLFLGAGDTFSDEFTLDKCSRTIQNVPASYNFAFGWLTVGTGEDRIEVVCKGDFNPVWMDLNYSTPPHSSTFTRSSIIKNNPFDARFKIIGDKKFMLHHSNGKYYNLQQFITIMDVFGISHNVKNIPLIWKENMMISKMGTKPPLIHKVKAYIVNYRNVLMLALLGSKNYAKCRKGM